MSMWMTVQLSDGRRCDAQYLCAERIGHKGLQRIYEFHVLCRTAPVHDQRYKPWTGPLPEGSTIEEEK